MIEVLNGDTPEFIEFLEKGRGERVRRGVVRGTTGEGRPKLCPECSAQAVVVGDYGVCIDCGWDNLEVMEGKGWKSRGRRSPKHS